MCHFKKAYIWIWIYIKNHITIDIMGYERENSKHNCILICTKNNSLVLYYKS